MSINKENKIKFFIENMLFYGGLSMLTKSLPFITLPLITKLLSDSESYGIADMFNVITSFGSAIAIMGMYDGIFREFFERKDDEEYQKKVTATGMNLVLISSLIISAGIYLLRFKLSIFLFKSEIYSKLISISGITIFFIAIAAILGAPTRMRNQKKIFLFTGVGFSGIGFLLTIFFIKIGYTYEALIYSTLGMSMISAFVFFILNKKDFSFKILDKKIARELYKVGVPLLPGVLIYWIFNSMDRIMINKLVGANELGIYSVGAKVASASQLIYTAFSGGWQYFSFSTMKDKDQVKVNSKIFQYLGVLSIFLYICSMPFVKPIFFLFFKGDYIQGYKVFSFLFLSPLMLMLFQILGNQLVIVKKSWLCTVSLFLGAIINLCLNYYLIPKYGIRGASVSTLFGYMLSVIIISIVCLRNKLLVLDNKFLIIFLILILGIILDFLGVKLSNSMYIVLLVLIVVSYFKDLEWIVKKNDTRRR